MTAPPDAARKQRRRQFGFAALALGAVLTAVGATLADGTGVAAAIGVAALAQGIGLVVAGASLAIGHNPLDRKDHRPR
jgi:hypothetical protein